MLIEKGFIYHIYNQGNNHRKIFFNQENYLFFLKKLKTYIIPYADILAWCLMPNHFHLMVLVKEIELPQFKSPQINKTRSINNSISIMLRSYTRAINKENNLSGSLFRSHTKADCLNCSNRIRPSFITNEGIAILNSPNPENEYPQICFNYIHQNPIKANLVKKEAEWAFSSAKDYLGLRNGKLINKNAAENYGLTYKEKS